jgi:dynein intermediate chain
VGAGKIGAEPFERDFGGPQRRSSVHTPSFAAPTISIAPIATNYEFIPETTKEVPRYSKAVQTSEPWLSPRHDKSSDDASDSDPDQLGTSRTPKAVKRLSRREREKEEELRKNLRREIEEELKAVEDPVAQRAVSATQPNFPARTLTEEELNAVISSEDFLDFVERSSKVIERALDEDYDVLVDYAMRGQEGVDDDEDEGYGGSKGKKGRRIREVIQFHDERWSKKRMISDLGFSPKVRPIILVSNTLLISTSFQSFC